MCFTWIQLIATPSIGENLTIQGVSLCFFIRQYHYPLFAYFRFPPKEDVVSFVVRTTREYLEKQPKTLVVVGSYSIGKEHVYITVSQALGVWPYNVLNLFY